jgi:hypothetical protein
MNRLVLLHGLDLPFPPCSGRPRGGLQTCLHGSSAYTGFILGSSNKFLKTSPPLICEIKRTITNFCFLCGLNGPMISPCVNLFRLLAAELVHLVTKAKHASSPDMKVILCNNQKRKRSAAFSGTALSSLLLRGPDISRADAGFELAKWSMAGSIFSWNCWKTNILIISRWASSTIQVFQSKVFLKELSDYSEHFEDKTRIKRKNNGRAELPASKNRPASQCRIW